MRRRIIFKKMRVGSIVFEDGNRRYYFARVGREGLGEGGGQDGMK